MKLLAFINLHAYFIRLNPPFSEPTKEILREIEEHILSIIQKERNPIQTRTQTQTDPNRNQFYPINKDTF